MVTTKSPLKIIRAAHELGSQLFDDRSHKFSPSIFTLPQLFACLVLREHQKKSYRGIEDSEANHCIAQEGMGIRAIIPPDTGRPTDKPPSTPYRREMRERFDSGADKGTCGQRWQVETVNSMIKRNLGSALRAKSAGRRSMELLLRCVTHNIMVLEGTQP